MNKSTFGAHIRDARKKSGLTSERVAELCNCTSVSIRQIESGVRLPSIPKFVKLCNCLKTSPNELLASELTFQIEELGESAKDQRIVDLFLQINQLPPKEAEVAYATLDTLIHYLRRIEH